MKLADAVADFWATVDDVEAFKPTQKRYDSACKVLKAHMVEKKLHTYNGIVLAETPAGDRLDFAAARAGLGAAFERYFEPAVRRSLIPFKRPKKHQQPAA